MNAQRFGVTIFELPSRSFSLHTEVSGSAPEDAFGSFRVLHQIGAGVLGPVFRAYDPERDRLVAVKLFRLDAPPERVHRLVAEFERLIAAELTHPSLAASIEAGIVGASAYLVQEYVTAESLDIALRDHGPMAAGEALRMAAQLASGLDFGAVAGIAHGALHPRDVMLSSDDARLTGIGIARALEQIDIVLPMRRPYTAPERMAAFSWDRRADIFGLAAVTHEMLWGRRITAIGAQAAEALTKLPGSDLDQLREVFGRALAQDPSARYETALEFAQELKHAFPDVAIGSRQSTVDSPQSSVDSRRSSRARSTTGRLTTDSTLTTDDRPMADDRLTTDDGRLTTDDGRLTTDDGRLSTVDGRLTTDAEPAIASAPPPMRADLDLRALDLHATAADRFADVGGAGGVAAPAPFPSGFGPEDVEHSPVLDVSKLAPAPFSAHERSRSAVWPLVLALGVGAALGFAGGYGVGILERAAATSAATATAPAGREFTEGTLSDGARAATREAPVPPETVVPTRKRDLPRAAEAGSVPTGRLQPDPAGRLLVRSTPPGAQVFVDGRNYGRTPVTVRDIALGTHLVRLVRDGYGAEERRVLISASKPSQSVTLRLSPSAASGRVAATAARTAAVAPATRGHGVGALTVESKPSGAQVFVDNRLVGATPLSLSEMSAGEHMVRLELDGYRRWSSSIRIAASERNRVTASLEK